MDRNSITKLLRDAADRRTFGGVQGECYAVAMSSLDVHNYELISRYYDVGYVQVTLFGTKWRLNFST